MEIRAKSCYDHIMAQGVDHFKEFGLINILLQLHEMEFDIEHIQYPTHLIDDKSFSFVVKYVKMQAEVEDLRRNTAIGAHMAANGTVTSLRSIMMPKQTQSTILDKCLDIFLSYVKLAITIAQENPAPRRAIQKEDGGVLQPAAG